MTKERLAQYIDLQAEQIDNAEKIEKLKKSIDNLERSIKKIVDEGTVIDSVSGGDGGKQHFRIEGFPTREYTEKVEQLQVKRIELKTRESKLSDKQDIINTEIKEIQKFFDSIDDVHVSRIASLRYERGMAWNQVANAMGGGNTADSVRKAMERYLKN